MSITEVLEYAKEKGEEVDFKFTNVKGEIVKCHTLDCWLGFFVIDGHPGFITESQWKENIGDIVNFSITKEK